MDWLIDWLIDWLTDWYRSIIHSWGLLRATVYNRIYSWVMSWLSIYARCTIEQTLLDIRASANEHLYANTGNPCTCWCTTAWAADADGRWCDWRWLRPWESSCRQRSAHVASRRAWRGRCDQRRAGRNVLSPPDKHALLYRLSAS